MLLKAIAFLAVGASGIALSAESRSAQITVSVTVVQSCGIDARSTFEGGTMLRLTCTAGTQSGLRPNPRPTSSETPVANGFTVLTLNF